MARVPDIRVGDRCRVKPGTYPFNNASLNCFAHTVVEVMAYAPKGFGLGNADVRDIIVYAPEFSGCWSQDLPEALRQARPELKGHCYAFKIEWLVPPPRLFQVRARDLATDYGALLHG